MPNLISDDFVGHVLNQDIWTTASTHPGNTITINNALLLSIAPSVTTCVRVATVEPVPTTGKLSITLTYTPGARAGGGSGVPYMALRPATIARDAYYDAPVGVPMLTFGLYSDTTALTRLPFGISGGAAYQIIGASPVISLPTGSAASIAWLIDWDARTMGVTFDGTVISADVPFVYSGTAPLFVEIANSGYNTSGNRTETIDDVAFGVASRYKLAGSLASQDGTPLSRVLRARRRDTGALVGQITTAPGTGEWELFTPDTLIDLQFMAQPGDGCDLFLPGRTPVEIA